MLRRTTREEMYDLLEKMECIKYGIIKRNFGSLK